MKDMKTPGSIQYNDSTRDPNRETEMDYPLNTNLSVFNVLEAVEEKIDD
jgi:hypothetical protein